MTDSPVTFGKHHAPKGRRGASYLALLSLGALGVVFGDIGTSPLYAMRESFAAAGNLEVGTESALGIASLMFWAMALIVTVKYIVFVMRADNQGEGGILALTALAVPMGSGRRRSHSILLVFGLFGTALLYGDGMITPAISVLSAVEGLGVATPALSGSVVPIASVILIGLFSVQRRGTASIGSVFGPVMILWFAVLSILGVSQILLQPSVLTALNPLVGAEFIAANPGSAFRALGAVFLVVTGSEALYADMGHFGRQPIRIGWFTLVFPALTLNYLGQAALVGRMPDAIENPFFLMAPSWSLLPLVLLATLATVIASQALITGAYSLTMQAVQLGFLPRVHIDHTSPREIGQVYIPSVNWFLMVACVGLVVAFRSSTNLAAAYGVAVTATMVITTLILHSVMVDRWRWHPLLATSLTAVFAAIDLTFFAANVLKIAAGGWFPLVVGLVIFGVMTTWRRGRNVLDGQLDGADLPIERFIASIHTHPQTRVAGTGVFLVRRPGTTPPALLANLRSNEVLHETVVLVTVKIADVPTLPKARRDTVHGLGDGFHLVVLTFGFMEETDVPRALSEIVSPDFGFDLSDATFFLGKESVIVTSKNPVAAWRGRMFRLMHRNATSAAQYFRLPSAQVMEVGTHVEL